MRQLSLLLAAAALAGSLTALASAAPRQATAAAARPTDRRADREDTHSPAGWWRQRGDEIRITAEGLAFTQPGMHPARYIDFGLRRRDVDAEVRRMRGAPTQRGRTERCRGGAMDFTAFGKLRLNYRGDRFVGWVLDEGGARPVIESDLGFGTGLRWDQAYYNDDDRRLLRRTARGHQFETGGIGGFVSSTRADGRVTRLYAGATCFARKPALPRGD